MLKISITMRTLSHSIIFNSCFYSLLLYYFFLLNRFNYYFLRTNNSSISNCFHLINESLPFQFPFFFMIIRIIFYLWSNISRSIIAHNIFDLWNRLFSIWKYFFLRSIKWGIINWNNWIIRKMNRFFSFFHLHLFNFISLLFFSNRSLWSICSHLIWT